MASVTRRRFLGFMFRLPLLGLPSAETKANRAWIIADPDFDDAIRSAAQACGVAIEVFSTNDKTVIKAEGVEQNLERLKSKITKTPNHQNQIADDQSKDAFYYAPFETSQSRDVLFYTSNFTHSKARQSLPTAFVLVDPCMKYILDYATQINLWYPKFKLDRVVSTADVVNVQGPGCPMIILEVVTNSLDEVLELFERVLGSDWLSVAETFIVRRLNNQ